MLMKRIINALYIVLISVCLASCGFIIDMFDLDNDNDGENSYYVDVRCHYYIQNKSSDFVRIRYPQVDLPKDSTVLFISRLIEAQARHTGNPRDSIKKDKYAYLNLDSWYRVYEYDAKNDTDNQIQFWTPNDNKKHSIYNKENWELTILRDTLYFDKDGNGHNRTRFQFYYPGHYGTFECAYTYTLTDEALEE